MNIEDSQGCIASASGMVDIWDPPVAENFNVSMTFCVLAAPGLSMMDCHRHLNLGQAHWIHLVVTGSDAYLILRVGGHAGDLRIDIQSVVENFLQPVAVSIGRRRWTTGHARDA